MVGKTPYDHTLVVKVTSALGNQRYNQSNSIIHRALAGGVYFPARAWGTIVLRIPA